MHIDLNSCFASIEQQANPLLRGKPIAVAAYATPRGCIIAPSVEAKRWGIKVGMRVIDGQQLCPELKILTPDPTKYRFVNRALLQLLNQYSPSVSVRSIDEMLLNFNQLPPHKTWTKVTSDASERFQRRVALSERRGNDEVANDLSRTICSENVGNASGRLVRRSPALPGEGGTRGEKLIEIAQEIKTRIRSEIGEWLTVSIGISTNPYLAKLAAGLRKPNGLDEINQDNILNILSNMKLTDLPYIKERNQIRLNQVGIKTPVDFYFASQQQLKAAFQSILGEYWYLRLHGYEIDRVEWARRSIGHSYALPKFTQNPKQLERLLCKLVEKMGRRLRQNNLTAQGMHVSCVFFDWSFWHKGRKFPQPMYANRDLFVTAKHLLTLAPLTKPVRILSVNCYALENHLYAQLTLFADEIKKRALSCVLDKINNRWGEFTIVPGTMHNMPNQIIDRIAFGGVLDMPGMYLNCQTDLYQED